MRHKYLIIGLAVILAIVCSGWTPGAQSSPPLDGSIEGLSNPELLNEADIAEFAGQNAAILNGPDDPGKVDPRQSRILKQEAGFFAKFINDQATDDVYQNMAGKMYVRIPRYLDADFKSSLLNSMMHTYDVVAGRWRKLGLEPPRGFIFVWIISDIDKMRREFATGENIMAFALPCRYIVIPYEVISDTMKYDLEARAFFNNSNPHEMRTAIAKFLQKSFATNFAHELTHVLTFTNIGFQRINDLDKWFYEGTAIWVSRDSGTRLSDEYKDYKRTFDFIRMKYGNQRFQQFIRDGIQKSVTGSLHQNLGLPHYGGLAQATTLWFAGMQRIETILSVLALLCLGLAVYRWTRTLPGYLYYLNIVLFGALYGLIFGYYNLWTNSVTGSAILNLLAVMLILFLTLLDIRHFYYHYVLGREIKKADADLHLTAEAAAYYPVEFENYQNMLELAKLNQRQWRYREGINWARDAAKTAQALSKTAETEGRSFKPETH